MEQTSGIGFREAAAIARRFVEQVYADGPGIHNVLLEEIEYDRVQDRWLVTIGFDRPHRTPPAGTTGISAAVAAMQGLQYQRAYKRIIVDNASGMVLKMVDREIEG